MEEKTYEILNNTIQEYTTNVKNEFKHLWNVWEIKLSKKEIHEVIGGLIARQISLAIHFMISTNNWNNEIAPVILRSMADNYINLAWILRDPDDRVRKFIDYGLSQEKITLEYRLNQVSEDGINMGDDMVAKASTAWINFQQFHFLTVVDFGSWSGLTVYKMAEEADCKDFYNYVYTPFSAAVHNMWNHIGKHNVRMSANPLHRHLLIPTIPDLIISLEYPELAAKYVEKCLDKFHQYFGLSRCDVNAYEVLTTKFDAFNN